MEFSTRNGIFRDTTRINIHDLVWEMNANVGSTVVQTMAGTKDRTSPHKWAKPDGPEPRPEVEARLRLGYRVWKTVEMAEGRNVALAWLMGANPLLDDNLPTLYIQQQRTREVLGAAEAFANDVHVS